jgi:hypothetical protein
MKDSSKRQPTADEPLRGDAAWKAHKAAIASRNDEARRVGRERRQKENEEYAAQRRAAERLEREDIKRRRARA